MYETKKNLLKNDKGKETHRFRSLKLSTINKKSGAMWSKVDNFFLI
jgi:hypothetical protein